MIAYLAALPTVLKLLLCDGNNCFCIITGTVAPTLSFCFNCEQDKNIMCYHNVLRLENRATGMCQ